MTRTHTSKPVWTWKCDECGWEDLLGRGQRDLPSTEEMRARGWYVAKLFGDKCPVCVARTANRQREADEHRAIFTASMRAHDAKWDQRDRSTATEPT